MASGSILLVAQVLLFNLMHYKIIFFELVHCFTLFVALKYECPPAGARPGLSG